MNDNRNDTHLTATLNPYSGSASSLSGADIDPDIAPEDTSAVETVDRPGFRPRSGLEVLSGEGFRPGIHSPLEVFPALLGFGEASIPVPLLPEGVSEEESLSMNTLSSVLTAYYRTLPENVRDEYVGQVMRFAGEKAGQLIRICSEH